MSSVASMLRPVPWLRMLPWKQSARGQIGAIAMMSTGAQGPGSSRGAGQRETRAVIFDMGGVILPSPLHLFKSIINFRNKWSIC